VAQNFEELNQSDVSVDFSGKKNSRAAESLEIGRRALIMKIFEDCLAVHVTVVRGSKRVIQLCQ
jgi:hypothetical protein